MTSRKETRICNVICVLLVLLAGAVRMVGYHFDKFTHNILICALFTAAIFIWICQVERRVMHREERRYLIWIACMVMFWMVLRTVKYEFCITDHFATRYIWYLYYVPQIFCVLFMLFSVLYIGSPAERPLHPGWKLLYVPAVLLVLGILTNDLHQMAFRFPEGLDKWNIYRHGPLYFVVVLWIAGMAAAVLFVVFRRCRVPVNRGKIWIPMLPLLIGIAYSVLYLVDSQHKIPLMLKVPEVISFVFIAFMEGLLLTHLLPSNDNYGAFWNIASHGGGIMDQNGGLYYRSGNTISVTKEEVQAAETGNVLLKDGDVALRSHAISGGWGYWIRDLSEINRLNRELSDLGEILAEENAMLDAENRMEQERIRIYQQKILHESLEKSVRPQLDNIQAILNVAPDNEEEFETAMKYACILNAYVKRRSNLYLLFCQKKWISSTELYLAISESLEYVRLYGVKTIFSTEGEGMIPGERILQCYEEFESLLEQEILTMKNIWINLKVAEEKLTISMETDCRREVRCYDAI